MNSPRIVLIGAPVHSLDSLQKLLAPLPKDFPCAVLVASGLNIPPAALSETGPLVAREAEDGGEISAGRIYMAPRGKHLQVGEGPRLQVIPALENSPIDPLFRSAALVCGAQVIAVLLGSGAAEDHDGVDGLALVQRHGGITAKELSADGSGPATTHTVPAAELGRLLQALVQAPATPVEGLNS